MSEDEGRFEAELAAWTADARAAEAAEERLRRHHFAQQERESATITGILVELAELGGTAELHLRQGSLAGVVSGVGPDVVEVRTSAGTALVPRGAVVAVTSERIGAGDAIPRDPRTLAARLAGLVESGSFVTVRLADAEWKGTIVSVGVDVVVLEWEQRIAALALDAVLAVMVPAPAQWE
ncbi:MAG TPA: hypothetical protein VMY34_00300 [Acidimicrobiales bacterium]|nr:hypothetical protein [Acidimicrobiales bacterium]